jgi:alpha-glucosidase
LEDAEIPLDRVVDPDNRDGCRAPIPWMADGDGEFGHGWSERPWLPFPPNAAANATERAVADPSSMYSLYRGLLALRRRYDVLRIGSMEVAPLLAPVMRFDRTHGVDRLTVLVNFADRPAPWPDDLVDADVLLSTSTERHSAGTDLGPDEAVVVRPATRG